MALTNAQRQLIAGSTRPTRKRGGAGSTGLAGAERGDAAESLRLTSWRYTGGEATVLEVVDAENSYLTGGERTRRRAGAL